MSFDFAPSPGIHITPVTMTAQPYTHIQHTVEGVEYCTPRTTASHDACCFSTFYAYLLDATVADLQTENIITLFLRKIDPAQPDLLIRFKPLFERIFNLFRNFDGSNTIIDEANYNDFCIRLVTDPIGFWRIFTQTGGSYFSTILFPIGKGKKAKKMNVRGELGEVRAFNTANTPEEQCDEIIGKLRDDSRCQYCGIEAGKTSTKIYRND
jgi:hypothetical protein